MDGAAPPDAGGAQDELPIVAEWHRQRAAGRLGGAVRHGRLAGSGAQQKPGGGAHFDRTLVDVLERLRNRFFGKYRGIVVDVDAATMRIKANVPAVLGQQPSGWARPCVPFAGASMGFAFLPVTGTGACVEF